MRYPVWRSKYSLCIFDQVGQSFTVFRVFCFIAIKANTYTHFRGLDVGFWNCLSLKKWCTSWCATHSAFTGVLKGQLISKYLFGVFSFLQKTNENKSTWSIIVVKSNSFVRFLEETLAWKNHFDFVWPLGAEFVIPFSSPVLSLSSCQLF